MFQVHDPTLITNAEVQRTNRIDRPYEVLSRPVLGRLIDTPDKLLAFQAAVMQSQGKPAPREIGDPLVGRVDAGRWLGDCSCGDAPVIDPDWSLACCLGCGAIYRNVVVPAAAVRSGIETALLARPNVVNRFWFPRETVDDLIAENAARGIGGVS